MSFVVVYEIQGFGERRSPAYPSRNVAEDHCRDIRNYEGVTFAYVEESRRQLEHSPSVTGGPCTRCGLRYSHKTAYVPCFEEGDTFESWLARQNEGVRELLGVGAKEEKLKMGDEDTRWKHLEVD